MNPPADQPFDPSKYIRKLAGRDYLEVKWRILWLRTEHSDAEIETELVSITEGFALFKAKVTIPGRGSATGFGSETQGDFLDFIEKAETKAIGRALAALGFGTQFCEDFAASPHSETAAETRQEHEATGTARTTGNPGGDSSLATPAQLKLIYLSGTRDLHITEEQVEERCQTKYGCPPSHLTKRQASEFIDLLKGGAR